MDPAAVEAPAVAYFVEAGASARGSVVAGAGAAWPSGWQAARWGGKFSLAIEAAAHAWAAQQSTGGRQRSVQVSATPVLRWRGDRGTSPWFLEAGIGLSLHSRDYVARQVRQSTRWNFNDVIGVGRVMGAHEMSLRVAHFSNCGLRKPNPGDTSVSLRWTARY